MRWVIPYDTQVPSQDPELHSRFHPLEALHGIMKDDGRRIQREFAVRFDVGFVPTCATRLGDEQLGWSQRAKQRGFTPLTASHSTMSIWSEKV